MNHDVTSTFAAIRENALARWRETFENGGPVILVGTATCGRAAGGFEVLNAIREALKEAHREDVPVIEVGCMGHCYAEPLVIITKPGSGYPPIAYGYVTPEIGRILVRD
ncbi:MAG: (2Fe-2S) ferredoxin domain-containing protein, partial [Chloroflexi bacterium]|nr:(2Fe-2S) ferredoxin domain-containing protein [Chloroflexota bacterium]